MEDEDPVTLFLSLDNWQEPQPDPDDLLLSHDSQSQSSTETYMVGFVIANIVGIQYYSGTITGREMVGLVRESLNPYDSNAIKVLNTRSVQVGHIERSVAAVLSPMIDSRMIIVEAIVPNTRAAGNRHRIPCQIHIFSRVEAIETVKSSISRGGLHLISDSDASFTLSEAMVVKEKKKDGNEFKSVDEIFKLVDENVNKKGALEALEPPKDVIKSELFVHQKEGLGWLIHRENSDELPPFWEEKDGSYVNVLTNYHTVMRPEPLRGGIFADDMGLGKTLTLLSLIAFDKCGSTPASAFHSASVDVENLDEMGDEDAGNKGKRGRTSKKSCAGSRKKRKIDEARLDGHVKGKSVRLCDKSSSDFESKTTLIVCPPSVFSTWVTQLGEHTRPGKLKVYMYYGDRTNEVEELKTYDIVLTTYSTLATEHHWSNSPMKKVEWWRVILDEAHLIKNVNAKQSRAVTDLMAKRRWVVTGTPIQNGSFDLFSLMAFLRFEPFSIKSYWQSLVQRPLAQGNQKGLSRLQVLMATISLRRTKEKGLIGLPPKTIETCYVELSREERELYDKMEGEAQSVFRDYVDAGSLMRNYSAVLSILLRLRQICIDLALCPSDLKTLLPSHSIEDVSNDPELLKKMVEVLQDGEDFDCPICISPPTNIVITRCAHVYCHACILRTLHHKSCCPLCRRPLTQSDLFTAPPEASDSDDSQVSSSKTTTSSKVSTLLKLLVESRDQNPATKSVIFSQFRKMLILLETPLKAAGFKILRLDGSMNAKKRAQIIKEFGVPGEDGPTVLLASLKASGTGINLTAASRVYLLEPWWNPAVEDQAMDRVHRIGQEEKVKIVRLIARNSIEERILELQEKKKKLAREAFGGRGPKDRREIGLEDLRTLMSL
ncbi:putative SWI/SNF-related matrix-associated actin-dependent regulator of chromatin subfamily A member 3-like 1 [Juglans microcarpa x Juglans regia]|uniref:putative SWI/SNF-related matrix-associated actin-dependent regulator of chromatin subfamily A member 3-like 1 n=1 Tax=Juglans microcarpa x Juglans regia TaxID=2249226 RepID=UPI001B7E9E79|nr:putative SWI/SNF-related matrix-associated actin-dependent regulator of chromatin subfamily A member 3-like 1 [Juglans microcarpa x Juglans regia]